MFLGHALAIDGRDHRGHAFMLKAQEDTQRLSKPQPVAGLHCHGALMPLQRLLGGVPPGPGLSAADSPRLGVSRLA